MTTNLNSHRATEQRRETAKVASRLATLVVLGFAVILFSGCFTSESPFYEEKQIVQDDRIIGTYEDRQDQSSWYVVRSQDAPGKYRLLLTDGGNAQSELVGTLFRLDNILYLDLFPLSDSGMRHDAGGPPTVSELVHLTLYERRHLVVKIELSDTNCVFWIPSRKGIAEAAELAPELKMKPGAVGPVMTFLGSTTNAQAYLHKFGTNSKVFDQKGQMKKSGGKK